MKSIRIILLMVIISATCSAWVNDTSMLPKADIVVAQDGSGQYKTMQAAINAVPDNNSKRTIIYIKNGTYNTEKLIVPASKTNVTILGESRQKTIISYHMYNCASPASQGECPIEDWNLLKDNRELVRTSASLTVMADGFIAENLTVSNTAGPVGQALAITLRGDQIVFKNCEILGYQDTILMANDGKRNYFVDCLVLGRTDYIYGAGIGYFQACEIRSYGGGWVTAPSTADAQFYGFVFNKCKFTYADKSPRPGDDGRKIALGRPWHAYPKVAILNSDLCEQMDPAGWPTTWNMEYAATSDKLHLYEYKNKGKGADMGQRAKWAGLRAMTDTEAADYTPEKVLGGWKPLVSN